MRILYAVKRILLAPLTALLGALDDFDAGELVRIVDKRTARAESAVLRDYFAQHGIEGEDAQRAEEEYRAKKRESYPDMQQLEQLRQRAETAEKAAADIRLDAEIKVQMARLGIAEQYADDVLLLASKDLRGEENENGGPEGVKAALEAVLNRIPAFAQPTGRMTAGARGNFPREEDAAASYRHQLERARAAGDNAAAVGIITGAASKGILLR